MTSATNDRANSLWRPALASAAAVFGALVWLASAGRGTSDLVAAGAAAALLLLWAGWQAHSGRPLGRLFGIVVLASFPLAFMLGHPSWRDWPYLQPSSGAVLTRVLGAAAAVAGSFVLVRWTAEDETTALAGWIAGPILLVAFALRSLEHGSPWRSLVAALLLVPVLIPGIMVALGNRRGPSPAGAIAGLAIAVLLPAVAIGVHEFAYGFDDWPCSSMNSHLRLQPWTRIAAMTASVWLLARAATRWVRGKSRRVALAMAAGALLVQVPASYMVTRSGCDGRIIESMTAMGAEKTADPGCPGVAACYCGVAYDGLDRPSLLRRNVGPVRLWVPAWLIEADRTALEHLLVHQEANPLPTRDCTN